MTRNPINKRKIYYFLASILALVMLLTPILGATGRAEANANNFMLNNTVFGPNQDITISLGTLTNACDDIYASSDIYIVPRGSVSSGSDLKGLDPSGIPNTLIGASGGVIAGETIGITSPSGNITDGDWDVVEDVCQDGIFNAGDTILSPGFTVEITVDVPPVPAFAGLKAESARLRDKWLDATIRFYIASQLADFYSNVGAMTNPADALLWLYQQSLFNATGINPSTVTYEAMLDTTRYYEGLAADPPDPEFRQISPLENRPIVQPLDNDAIHVASAQLGTALGDESELLRVLLASLERYQGADVDDNGDWALIHARATQNYADLTAVQLLETNAALAALENALANNTLDLDTFSSEAVIFQNRLAADGFTDDELREAANLGLSNEALEALRTSYLEVDYSFSKADFLTLINEIQTTNIDLIAELNTLSADMAPIITTLENDPLVSDRTPLVDAGGPYSGTAGTAITLDATASTNLAQNVEYNWDLDGDGEFDDAVGATAAFTFTQPYTGLVGLQVANDGYFSNIDYTPISIAPVNGRPAITTASPTDRTPEILLPNSQTFSVTAVDPDGDALSIYWQVDGVSVGSGGSFVYAPDAVDIGLHRISATVFESTPAPGAPVSHFWLARVIAVDSDGDGWNTNVDCDDANASVNPGMDEITGNGIDDDCDVTTSDVPPVPAFSFAPATPFISDVVSFTDASTDADGSVVAWEWDFGDTADPVTSTLQHPSHIYSTPGTYTITLQVTDSDGGLASTSQSITIYQPLNGASFITSNHLNKARSEDGAVIVDVSSESTTSGYQAPKAIDDSTTTYWSTKAYEITDQWLVVDLVGDEAQFLSEVVLRGDNTTNSARNFELFLSETGTDEADFTSVLTGEIPRTSELTSFNFAPTWAKYAKLHIYDNWGNNTYIRLSIFQLNERPREGGIVSLANAGPTVEVVEYSGHYSTLDPNQAFDASLSTGWRPASGVVVDAWMKFELSGQPTVIDTIQLASKYAHIKDFEIKVSSTTTDDAAFTMVYSGTAVEDDTLQTYTFPPVTAKYVQLIVHDTYANTYLYVTMLKVLAEDGVNLASLAPLNATVAAYSSYDYYTPNSAIDFSTSGSSLRWRSGSGQTTDQWLKVRLSEGGSYLVNRVFLEGDGDDESPQDFEIRVSNNSLNDTDFTTVFSGTLPADEKGHYFTFPPVEARYVQLYIHNNHGHATYIQVSRFFVYSIDRGGPVVPFHDTSPNQEAITSWLWDFGDGSTSTEQHPTHTYAAPGTYLVTLTIDSGIETASTTMPYTVFVTGQPHFNIPANIREGYSVWFTDNSTPAPDTALLGYTWDFSVSTASGSGAYANFPDNGDYPVSITVLDTNFLRATYTDTVSVANVAPNVNAGSDRTALALDPMKVHYNSSISDVGPIDSPSLVCDWDFGDGNSTQVQNCDDVSIQVTHVYSQAGVYTATVTVSDKDGGTDTDSLIATIGKRETLIGVVGMRSVTTDTAVIQVALTDNVIGSHPLAGFPVSISADGQTINTTTNELGLAEGTFNINHGEEVTVTADYAGNATYFSSSHTVVEAPAFDDELDDEFWVAFPSNWDNSDTPYIFVASATDAVGVVTIAELGFVHPFTITGGSAAEIQVPAEAYLSRQIMAPKMETFSYKAIHVVATADVQVYGLATVFGTSDAYTALPIEDLGTDYMIMTYRNAQTGILFDDYPAGEIAIVGVQPTTTTITITLPNEAPYTISLAQGQTYQVVDSMKTQGGLDYTGAIITADQPVSVFGGSNCTQIPATYAYCDHLVEQMLPIETWGWSFATMPLATRINGDTFRVLAQKDNTNVYIDGVMVDTLNAAEFYETILTEPAYITADQPILVAQFSNGSLFDGIGGSDADPFMMLLPPYELATNYYPGISTPPSIIDDNYVNLIVRNEDVGVAMIDDVVITPTLFVPISGTDFSGVQLPISVGQHVLESELPFSVYVYGFDYYNSFGYPGGGFLISDVALTADITATPSTAIRPLNETHCVTATVTDENGSPLENVRVDMSRTGVHPALDFAFTDENGEAIFCYDGTVQGTDTITVTTGIFSSDATVSWQDNLPPVTVDDNDTTNEDSAVILDVLLNDNDPDGDPLTVITVTQAANGSVVINPDNTLTYTPDADYNSTDSAGLPDTFTYTLVDGSGGSATANVAVMVTPVNDDPIAVDDEETTNEDAAVTVDLLSNDTDIDGDSLTLAAISDPSLGSAVDNGNGTITYTPDANLFGTDVFSYTVDDGIGGSATASVSIEIVPANDNPDALDDSAVVDEDSSITIPVLDNDGDIDGDTIQLVAVIAPANGMVTMNPDGTVTYAPYGDFNGPDSFSYTIDDGNGAMDTAVVNLTVSPVNDAPEANDDPVATLEDTPVTINVLNNDDDIDDDPLLVSITTDPVNGSAVLNTDGTITYTPNPSYNGVDTLGYTLSDGFEMDTAVVTISITPDNDNPDAADDLATTLEDNAVTFDVLPNDIDIDGDAITVSEVTDPANGTIVINPDGTLTYTPDADFNGNDSLVYTVVDGFGGADTAVVILDVTPVNDDPVANNNSDTTNEDGNVTIAVLDNDSDKDGDSLMVSAVTPPANGTAVINPDGTLTYTPVANFNGNDVFSYTIEDGNGGSASANVTILVNPVNDDPEAVDDTTIIDEDTQVTIAILDNDSDLDGDSLAIASVTVPANGTAVVNPDNTVTYTPDVDFNGADSFDYSVDDGNGGIASATVIVIINSVSDVCEIYPIALHEDVLANVQPGDILADILNGEQPGNFGWLTWTGDNSTPALIESLSVPGNSNTYVNPNDPDDMMLSVGDWVEGKPGVSNAQGVRDALDILQVVEIVVPIWDVSQGNGANAVYHITGFATIRILDYDLPGQDQITAEFLGFTTCDG